MAASKVRPVYQLLVTLRDVTPPIWRRLHVFEDITLPALHDTLQTTFDWEDYHLHEFIAGRRTYAIPDAEDELYKRRVHDERKVPLRQLLDRVGKQMEYHYDFGDNWRLDILLEAIFLPEPRGWYPACIDGQRAAPPEDSGGPHGYARYLEALIDPDHPDHEEKFQWRGPFDPELFPKERLNMVLLRRFGSRRRRWAEERYLLEQYEGGRVQ